LLFLDLVEVLIRALLRRGDGIMGMASLELGIHLVDIHAYDCMRWLLVKLRYMRDMPVILPICIWRFK
jgi:hypothetical protein